MKTFVLHPNPEMGIYVEESQDPLLAGQMVEWAFRLSDNELSDAYRQWRETQQ